MTLRDQKLHTIILESVVGFAIHSHAVQSLTAGVFHETGLSAIKGSPPLRVLVMRDPKFG